MNLWEQLIDNKVLICALLGWLIAQVLKVVFVLVKERRLDIGRLVGSGGMPSSHSAFVSSMATAVGISLGFDTAEFAIAFVLAFIVMYDASGVRKAAGEHAKVINDIQKILEGGDPEVYLKELLGHTGLEVIVGACLGVIIALIMFL